PEDYISLPVPPSNKVGLLFISACCSYYLNRQAVLLKTYRKEEAAFRDCVNLESITIPSSVTSIEWDALDGCTNLTSIKWNGKTYTSVNEFWSAFNNR
ncbi:MAG: leucine-rich repeat domain-containing protein, partial [Ruminococcus flavefaciens]|nr:leucine-rich repeat domain-containing protein [Ruminococcus flavefaciens]